VDDLISFFIFFVAAAISAGGGIGGGGILYFNGPYACSIDFLGIFIPILVLVCKFVPKEAVPLSNVSYIACISILFILHQDYRVWC
jgi:hypothetical protein